MALRSRRSCVSLLGKFTADTGDSKASVKKLLSESQESTMHQQSSLTAVRKVYARKVTSMVSPFSGSVLQFPVVDRQWEQWCELQSERCSIVARGGKKLVVTECRIYFILDLFL